MRRLRTSILFASMLLVVPCHAASVRAALAGADGQPLSDAVVYAVPLNATLPLPAPKTAEIDQRNKMFLPAVSIVQTGAAVAFPNSDNIRHQVYSFSPAKSFELKLYAAPEVGTQLFDKEGAVSLGCNIHDNMLAYVYVVATPYFAASDEKGQARIPQIPAGNYVMKTWHPSAKAGVSEGQPVAVPAEGALDVTAQVELKRERRQRKPGAVDERDY